MIIIKILIAGDLVPTKSNKDKFEEQNFIDYIGEDFKKIWLSADYRIINLETPLGENLKPIDKNGPNIIASRKAIIGIKSLCPDIILLANNHIKDYGIEGIDNTIRVLKENQIQYTGILDNCDITVKPIYIEKDNIKIGIYNVCENEFSISTKNEKGSNQFEGIKNYIEVSEMKKSCDYLFVLFHGGKEHYRYPSPNLQKICRGFVDSGADLVVTQHSHCIGCKEEYKNKTIIYGQGNFIFADENNEYWNTSLIISADIEKDSIKFEYIPIERKEDIIAISKDYKIVDDFLYRSEQIKNSEFIEKEYEKIANENLNMYINMLHKISFKSRVLNKLTHGKYIEYLYNKKDYIRILNIIECEAHRELLIRGLKSIIRREKDEK